jgi:multidrug transporter EmrE-like cation transporter
MNTDTIILAFWIILAATMASLQVIFIKKYLQTNDWYWIGLSLLTSIILLVTYIKTFNGNEMCIIYPIIKILSIIIVIITGDVFFKNKITMRIIVGIILSIISIYLLVG